MATVTQVDRQRAWAVTNVLEITGVTARQQAALAELFAEHREQAYADGYEKGLRAELDHAVENQRQEYNRRYGK